MSAARENRCLSPGVLCTALSCIQVCFPFQPQHGQQSGLFTWLLSMLSLCPSLAFDLLLLLHLSPSQPSFRCVSSSSRLHELCRVWLLLYVMSFVLGQGPGMLPWVALNPWALARVCTPPAGWVCVSVQSLVFPTPIPIFFLHYGNILLCARSFGDSF